MQVKARSTYLWITILLIALIATLSIQQAHAQNPPDRWSGTLRDDMGLVIADALVRINGEETTTANDGSFELYVPRSDDNRWAIWMEKQGHVPYPAVHVGFAIEGATYVLPQATTYQVDPSQDIALVGADGEMLRIPADALVDSSGALPAGDLLIDFDSFDIQNGFAPGDQTGVVNGEIVSLDSYGMFSVEVYDFAGNEFNLRDGAAAELSTPVLDGENPPEEMVLLSYKEKEGVWLGEGRVKRDGDRLVSGEVRHFSVYNFDLSKDNPACVLVTLPLDIPNSQLPLDVRAVLQNPVRTRFLSLTQSVNVLYNLPPNEVVNFYYPANSNNLIATANTGAPWIGTDIPPFPYDVCNGEAEIDPGTPAIIKGVKYEDTNGNGAYDTGEPTLPNWEILIQDQYGSPVQSVLTDASGGYTVTGLLAGDYLVNEVITSGWIQTQPGTGGYAVTLGEGDSAELNFGNRPYDEEHCEAHWDIYDQGANLYMSLQIYNNTSSLQQYEVQFVAGDGLASWNGSMSFVQSYPNGPALSTPFNVNANSNRYIGVKATPFPTIMASPSDYLLIVTNIGSGESFSCGGHLNTGRDVQVERKEDNVQFNGQNPQKMGVDIRNIAKHEIKGNARVMAMFVNERGEEIANVRLDGQAQGEAVRRELKLAVGEVARLEVDVELIEDVRGLADVMFELDLDGNGEFEIIQSVLAENAPDPSDGLILEVPVESVGELSIRYSSIIFPPIAFAGQDVLVQAAPANWAAIDNTGLGAGWRVTLSANDHLRGETSPANPMILVGEGQGLKVAGCQNAALAGNGPAPSCQESFQAVPLVSETPIVLLSAAPNAGRNVWGFAPEFQLLFPGNGIVDTYSTTLNATIIAGP